MTDTKVENPLFVVFAAALESQLSRINPESLLTSDDVVTAILDIQEHDRLKTDDAIAALLILGTVARKRSIEYARATKAAKEQAAKSAAYSRWVSQNPVQALNPAVNLSMQLAYGVITRETFDSLSKTLNEVNAVQEHKAAKSA